MRKSLSRSSRIFMLLLSIVLVSCRSIPVQDPVIPMNVSISEKVKTNVVHDSIYMQDSVVIYKDSLVERWHTKIKNRTELKTDTLHVRDTINVIVTKSKNVVVYKQTWMQKRLSQVGTLAIIAFLVWLTSKCNWKSILKMIITKLKK